MGFYSIIAIVTLALTVQCHCLDGPAILKAINEMSKFVFDKIINIRKLEANSKDFDETTENTNTLYEKDRNTYAKIDEAKLETIKRYLANVKTPVLASLVNNGKNLIIKLNKKRSPPLLINVKPYDPFETKHLTLEENGKRKYSVVLQIGLEKYPITFKINTNDDYETLDEDDEAFPVIKLTTKDYAASDNIKLKHGDAPWPIVKLVKQEKLLEQWENDDSNEKVDKKDTLNKHIRKPKEDKINKYNGKPKEMIWTYRVDEDGKMSKMDRNGQKDTEEEDTMSFPDLVSSFLDKLLISNSKSPPFRMDFKLRDDIKGAKEVEKPERNLNKNKKLEDRFETETSETSDVKLAKFYRNKLKKSKISA